MRRKRTSGELVEGRKALAQDPLKRRKTFALAGATRSRRCAFCSCRLPTFSCDRPSEWPCLVCEKDASRVSSR